MLVGGLVAYGTHKMSQKDAERIQQHTGVDPEEMTDDELVHAMNDLGIEQQAVTAQDMSGQAPAAPAPAAPAPAAGAPSGGTDLDMLQKLGELHAKGILTDEEFAAKKAQILGL